jgi:hypothetical protein
MLHVPEAFIVMLVLETQCQYQLVLIEDWSQRIGRTTHFQNTKILDQSISVLVLVGNITVYIPEKGDESCAHKEKTRQYIRVKNVVSCKTLRVTILTNGFSTESR